MVLERPRFAVGNFREPDPHRGPVVQRPPGGLRSSSSVPRTDGDAEFLQELAVQRAFGGLPGSTLPPGNSHMPANCGGAVRRATRSRAGADSESTTAPPTTLISSVTGPVYEARAYKDAG